MEFVMQSQLYRSLIVLSLLIFTTSFASEQGGKRGTKRSVDENVPQQDDSKKQNVGKAQITAPPTVAVAQVKLVISTDLDDVFGTKPLSVYKDGANLCKMSPVAGSVFCAQSPCALLKTCWYMGEIKKRGQALSKKGMIGSSNIFHTLIGDLRKEGICNLTPFEDDIVAYNTTPRPITPMIDNFKQLKAHGHPIIAVTNQDFKQHMAWRKTMLDKFGVDLNKEFDAVLTTRVMHVPQAEGESGEPFYHFKDNVYVAKDVFKDGKLTQVHKPHKEYFEASKKLAQKITGKSNLCIIHTDDSPENVKALNAPKRPEDKIEGMHGILFQPAQGDARDATAEELDKSSREWRSSLVVKMGMALISSYNSHK